jgi:endonuclease YncB( thermonuclease family)
MVLNDAAGLTLLFVLLSLVAFWLSTQQSGLLIRLPIWIAGAGLLALAAFQALQIGGQDALKRVAEDVWATRITPEYGVLFQTLSANLETTRRYVAPLLDLMIVFGAILGVFAFLALTPGDFLERVFVRPLAIGLLGATIGAALALAAVAISFGGPVKLRQYAGMGEADRVYDGDTFWLGDVSLRLLNIDAPELKQKCGQGVPDIQCGEASKSKLAEIIDGKVISCVPQTNADGRTRESFGRPLVTCTVLDGGPGHDVGQLMVASGYAAPYAYKTGKVSPYAADEAAARASRLGLWSTCTLRPDVWRESSKARFAFISSGTIPADPGATFGDCAKQPRTPA